MTDPTQRALDLREKRERRTAKKRRLLAAAQIDAFNDSGAGRIRRPKPDRKVREYNVAQLLNQYRDPRAVLLEIASTPTAKLAETLRCSALEASQERRHAALAVLPYVASKMPVQVDMRHTRAVHIHFDDADTLTLEPHQAEQHQIIDLSAETIDEVPARGQKAGASRGSTEGN